MLTNRIAQIKMTTYSIATRNALRIKSMAVVSKSIPGLPSTWIFCKEKQGMLLFAVNLEDYHLKM